MRHDEAELVLTGFREDRREGVRDEVLELVDVEVEAFAIFLRNVGTRHRGHVHFVDEDESEQLSIHVTDLSFTQVHEKDLALIHDLTDVEGRLRLTDDVAHRGIRDEGAELRGEVRDHLFFFTSTRLRDFILPEAPHDDVLALAHLVPLELIIDEESWDIDECRTFLFIIHERETSITEVMLNTWTEDFVSEELDEDFHGVERRTILLLRRLGLEKIESHRTLHVGRIEDDDVLRALLHRVGESILDEVTVRIDDAETGSSCDVLTSHPVEERRFTRT